MMSLLNCYLPLFRLVTTLLTQPQLHEDYAVFRSQCIELLEQALCESELHHEQQECEDAYFAVVLYLDERVLCSTIPWVKEWRAALLQKHYFNISVGGEEFFTRLDTLDKTNTPLRMVFLFCLLMGFHGKYTQQDAQLLQQRIDSERECLPEAWRQWPNEANLVEPGSGTLSGNQQTRKKLRQRKGLLLSLPLFIYALMLAIGSGFFTG
ncbi:DotU family type IV/VI secretion system protein [Buttiauxella sp. A2-C2_NF]|uniref:DotU family type IV/VI secretion system protein n=1 Tax=Buttiauxella TaxID=82976 RepID=UPI00105F6400|nr:MULTISPECIES: DotU family type IV/VI secretion system protein [Buttiauxella]MCE0826810.1 DotU family type IV/VI secretion system protein [Buttiauxella ferragutiae]TDN54994.1 type VI secretion system protein ImpK [Buttiauxella sp. JUb87]